MPAAQPIPAAELARPYSSVAVGTDFTPCSAVAIGQALRIAAWSGAPCRVVHVIDITVVTELEAALSAYQQAIQDNLVKDAQKAWGEFAATIPGAAGLPLHVSVNNRLVGILNHDREHKADLLVMGAFGDRRPDVGFGTVATACVRKSMTDVLLVRDTQAGPFKCVVAAVDFSETSARALARAALFAVRDGAELHVLHVFAAPWHRLHYRAPEPMAPAHLQKQYRDALERRLTDFVGPIGEANPGLRVRPVCYDYGGHRSGIVEYAKKVSADLIALGTRGRTNLRDILLGSTAEKALDESPCSVLAVKPAGFHHPLAAGGEPQLSGLRPQF
ncbi:MAG: universal stress protein [Phycisphaerales bacterium]|nr:universal stress protein [Phycisphaerales bacterium]